MRNCLQGSDYLLSLEEKQKTGHNDRGKKKAKSRRKTYFQALTDGKMNLYGDNSIAITGCVAFIVLLSLHCM